MSSLKYPFVFAFYASVLSACADQPAKTTEQNILIDTVESSQTSHTAQNSLDWEGSYEGRVECNACEGALTTVQLMKDQNYKYKSVHVHNNKTTTVESEGSFQWLEDGKTIVSNNQVNGSNLKFIVVENALLEVGQKKNSFKTTEPSIHRLEKLL